VKKRKVTYPPAKTATRQPRGTGPASDTPYVRSTVAEINVNALNGRDDLAVGDRVRIGGGGLYSGENAVIESLVSGLIPAAMVRTEAGKTRRVRAIDLERVVAPKLPPKPVTEPTAGV
jgi:hypothetical protein